MGKQSGVFTFGLIDLTLTLHPFAQGISAGNCKQSKDMSLLCFSQQGVGLGSDSSLSENSGWCLTRWSYSESI